MSDRTTHPTLHPPKQARSRETLRNLVRAALDIIAHQGVEAATVQAIVDRAGSSVGSFYARFDGKDDLLRYLEERVWEDARERWDEALESGAWDDLGLEAVVRGVVQVLLEIQQAGAGARQALQARHPAHPEAGPAAAFYDHLRSGMRGLLLARSSEMGHPDPPLAVDVGLRVMVGAVREVGRVEGVSDAERVDELTRMLLGYLGSGQLLTGSGESLDFFDVWA